jgi:voltage-gated potassium channel
MDRSSLVVRRWHKQFFALSALGLVLLIGTVGYHVLGAPYASWMDSLYMTFITITTIGYVESVDVSQYEYGRLFTIFIGMTGIGVIGYVISTATAFMLESDLNETWRRKRMQQAISRLSGHYIVCGIGRVGSNVAHELAATGHRHVVIDTNGRNLELFRERHADTLFLHADAADNDVLVAAGIRNARGLFAVASEDNMNLVIALSAKQLNPGLRVVARCHDLKNMEKLRLAGADEIVSPDFTGGLRIVSAMLRPQLAGFMEVMQHSENSLRMEEFEVPEPLHGRALGDWCPESREYVALGLRHDQRWIFKPEAAQTLSRGDLIVVMTTPQGRQELERRLAGA